MLDDKNAGAFNKRRVTDVIQHELAHQWFGNLVTMDWWYVSGPKLKFISAISLQACYRPCWPGMRGFVASSRRQFMANLRPGRGFG